MEFIEDSIIEILNRRPSECAYIDYKVAPYIVTKKHDFVKDVIAMLNSEESIGKNRYIIIGVENEQKTLVGIKQTDMRDDNEFQSWLDNISPRPMVQTGTVEYDGKLFGYVVISKDNDQTVYEVATTVIGDANARITEKNGAYKGQAFGRTGSRNIILNQAGRTRILQKKIQKEELVYSGYNQWCAGNKKQGKSSLAVAAMIGSWSENYHDKEVIEKIYEGAYSEFIGEIKSCYEKGYGGIKIDNNSWTISNRIEVLTQCSNQIYDNDISVFMEAIKMVLNETDPRYELERDKRFAAGVYAGKRKYSLNLLEGMMEFIAFAGNNESVFVSCSLNNIKKEIKNIILFVFSFDCWKKYASISGVYQYLAEGAPQEFLDELENLIRKNNSHFEQYLKEKETGISTTQYGYQIGWVLMMLASHKAYFSKASYILFLLGKINEIFIDDLVAIILPWYPQTEVAYKVRISIVESFFEEDDEVAWELLVKLLPGETTMVQPTMQFKYLKNIELAESVAVKEYWDVSDEYVKIACKYAGGNRVRLLKLISIMHHGNRTEFEKVVDVLIHSKSIMTKDDKQAIWLELSNLVDKHRKYKDTEWALPEEALVSLEAVMNQYFFDASEIKKVRLFGENQIDLLERNEKWSDGERRLFELQKEIIQEKFENGQISAVYDFMNLVERPDIIGRCLAELNLQRSDCIIVISNIIKETKVAEVARGFICQRYKSDKDEFQGLIQELETDYCKAKALLPLALDNEVFDCVSKLPSIERNVYWQEVNVRGMQLDTNKVEIALEQLFEIERFGAAINLLYMQIFINEQNVANKWVIKALKGYTEEKNTDLTSRYEITCLIKWLQEHDDNAKDLCEIEWKYLVLLDERSETQPISLQMELSSNPTFFIDVISRAYKRKSAEKAIMDELAQKIATQCYRLLNNWRRMPGTNAEGKICENDLNEWFSQVKQLSKECDRYEVAMKCVGQVCYYAPKSEDGFWLARPVANLLQKDTEGFVRSGYELAVFNSRGVHNFDGTGEAEFALEKKYMQMADQADEEGLFRLAATMRRIARSYHYEALHNIEEAKQWDKEK